MNILMMSLMYPDDMLEEAARNSRDGLQNQINSYQRAFVEGIDANLQEGERLEILNGLPVGSFPTHYRKLVIRGGMHGKRLRELGCLNLPWFKQRGRRRRAQGELLKWAGRDPHNRTVLLYTLYLPFMQAVANAKKKYPDLRASVIVTDLPNELGISSGRRGFLKRIEHAMGSDSMRLCSAFDGFALLTRQMADVLPIEDKAQIVIEGLITESGRQEKADRGANNRPAILYTGTLNRELGIADLLEAFENLPECDLWLCGKGDMEAQARQSAEKHANIRYYGFVPQKEAIELQARATLLVNPRSPEGVFTRYSFPSKTLEYMRSGKPVLCYRLDGIPEDYDAYLCYIEQAGAQGIAAAVRQLLKLPASELARRGEAGRRYVLENKNPRVQCARLLKMLRGL